MSFFLVQCRKKQNDFLVLDRIDTYYKAETYKELLLAYLWLSLNPFMGLSSRRMSGTSHFHFLAPLIGKIFATLTLHLSLRRGNSILMRIHVVLEFYGIL